MAARGVAEMMSRISKEEEEDEASLWWKNDRRRRTPGDGSSEIAGLSWWRRGERMHGGE
jgi:hypothetical protein